MSLGPAIQAGKAGIVDDLKDGARTVAGGPRGRLGSVLVVAELGLSLVLLVGATLLVKSFIHRCDVGAGFDTKGVLTARIALSGEDYSDKAKRAVFLEEALCSPDALPPACRLVWRSRVGSTSPAPGVYRRHRPETTVLHEVVRGCCRRRAGCGSGC